MQTAMTLLGSALLIAGTIVFYRVLAWPYVKDLGWPARVLLLVLVLAMMVALGVPFWWFDARESFPWDLPPLASRMLASAGLSFVVLSFLVLRRPNRRRIRLLLTMLVVYLVPLLAVIWTLHLDRFDRTIITPGFLLVADVLTVLAIVCLVRTPEIVPPDAADDAPSSSAVRVFLAAVAVVCVPWGLALFVTDDGPSELVWAWPGDLLSSRLIGVMLLAVAAGAIYAWRWADASRVMLWTIAAYGFGLALASLWQLVGSKPLKPGYLLVFGLGFVVAAALVALDGQGPTRLGGEGER